MLPRLLRRPGRARVQGETRGRVADRARGRYKFAWDPIFVPDGASKTYGQMGLEGKRETSPVYRAWDTFLKRERRRLVPHR